MTLKIYDSLPGALAQVPAPHLSLLAAITQCNKDKKYYITREFQVAIKKTRREKGPTLDEVVAAFNVSISRIRIADIPTPVLDQARVEVLTYIDQAVGISFEAKADTRTGFLKYIDLAIERKRPLLWLKRVVSSETVNEVDRDFLKVALESMALERACLLKLSLQMAGHYYCRSTLQKLQRLGLPLTEKLTLNWLGIIGYTIEEMAIGFVLGKLLTLEPAKCRKLVMELKEEEFESRASYEKTVRDWNMILCYDQCCRIAGSLRISHVNMDALVARSLPRISNEIIAMIESMSFLSAHPNLPWNVLFEPVVSYQAQADKLNDLYQKGFELYSKLFQQEDPNIPPPSAFAALKMPSSLEGVTFEPEIETSDAEVLQNLLNSLYSENSLTQKALLDILSNKTHDIEALYQAAQVHHKAAREAVLKKLAEIKPAEPSPAPKASHPRRKLKKLIKENSPQPSASAPTGAKPKPIEYVPPHWLEALNQEPLWLAERVKDWSQKSPSALQKEPYLSQNESEKENAVFHHTYPLIVTKILRKFVKPELWRSPTHNKENLLYKCAGMIERYDLKIKKTGYFTDCFDKTTDELYHHFFQPTSALALMAEHHIDLKEIQREETSGQAQKEEITLYDRYKVTVGSFLIVIDDEQNKTKYMLFCPTTG